MPSRPILWILLACLAIILAATASVLVIEQPWVSWVQVLGDGVLRTNAPSKVLGAAKHTIAQRHQNWIEKPDGTKSDPTYRGGSQGWSTGSSPDRRTAEVVRAALSFRDEDGHQLAFERIRSTGAPTLIFIEYERPGGRQAIVTEMLQELQRRGVRVR